MNEDKIYEYKFLDENLRKEREKALDKSINKMPI